MVFSDIEEGHDHAACRRVAFARWCTMLTLLGILLINSTFCFVLISKVRTWLENHARYVYARDAKWEPRIDRLDRIADFVDRIIESEKIKAVAAAKVQAEKEAREAAKAPHAPKD